MEARMAPAETACGGALSDGPDYKEFQKVHTSSGTQLQGQESEQLFGGVAQVLYRSPVPSTIALP